MFGRFRREYQRAGESPGKGTRPLGGGVADPAVGLRASSTLVGLGFGAIAQTATGLAGSAPIAGKVQLEGIWIVSGVLPVAGGLHRLQLAIDSEVPSTAGDVDAGEQLFTRANTIAGELSTIDFGGLGQDMWLPLTTVVAMNGRRFIGRIVNQSTAAAGGFYVGLVMHRVYGGASSGDPAFLSGEEVELR